MCEFFLGWLRQKNQKHLRKQTLSLPMNGVKEEIASLLIPRINISCFSGNKNARLKGRPTQDFASFRQYGEQHWKMVVCDGVSNAVLSQYAAQGIGKFILENDVSDFDIILRSSEEIRNNLRADLLETPYFKESLNHPVHGVGFREELESGTSSTTLGVVDVRWHEDEFIADYWFIGNCAAFVIDQSGCLKHSIYHSKEALRSNKFVGIDIWPGKNPPITLFPDPKEYPEKQQNVGRSAVPVKEGDTIFLVTDGLGAGFDEYLERYSGKLEKLRILQEPITDEGLTLLRDEFEREGWIEDDDVSFVQMTIRSADNASGKV